MRSGTLFFNSTVYKKTVFRFWPLWAVNLVFWGMLLPMNGLMAIQNETSYGTGDSYNYVLRFAEGVGEYGTEGALVFALIAGLLVAMAVCSHLYSARSANFMGALPIRREGLFLSHYAAGLTMLLVPNVVIFLMTLLVEAAGGAVEMVPLVFWLLSLSAMELFFYSFAVCIGMFAGHLLALPVYYGVFNCLVMAVYFLFGVVMDEFYFGYANSYVGKELAMWFTPVYVLSNVDIDRGEGLTADTGELILGQYRIECASWLAIYAVVAVALTVIALLVYRRRHLETAGDVVAVKVMRPVFKYGVAICAGLFFGFLTTRMLSGGEVSLMVSIVLWGLAGYFVAQMFLDKSFRVFRKWKGGAAVTAVFAVMFLVVGLDLTGYETRVPDADGVVEVRIRGLYSAPYDSAEYINESFMEPEIIEKAVAVHQAIVDDIEAQEGSGVYPENSAYKTFRVTYTMADGSTMAREYDVCIDLDECGTPGTIAYAMDRLVNDRELVWKLYGIDEMEENCTLRYVEYGGSAFYGPNAERLLAAVKADFAAGNIGVRSLGDKYNYDYDHENGLSFCWQYPGGYYNSGTGETVPSEHWIYISVPDTAKNTLALLEELAADYTVTGVPTDAAV